MNQVILVWQVEGTYEIIYDKKEAERKLMKFLLKIHFNFVENSWWNKKNHQYDNLKNNFV